MDRTKVVKYADDFIMATRGESIRAVENYTNVELSKIKGWARNKRSNSMTPNLRQSRSQEGNAKKTRTSQYT